MAEELMLDILKRAVGYLSLHGYEAEAKALSVDARALLAAGASEGQMPVAIYHGNGIIDCGDSGHHNIELLKMIPAGAKLYKDPSGEIAVLREALKGAEIIANAAGAEIAALRERIAGMEKDPGWISVEDQLPKNDQIVAFVVKADRESPNWYLNGHVLGGTYHESWGFSTPGVGHRASYWMPLPEAPASSVASKEEPAE
ncbi:DUF551 domain-containing protein [Caballeronia sp. GAWG1-5s-s]|uniref:DUF551 domain-containing protein n=1 Tax=Caballeronia sp. GAWG1-5s-s TaxID=2921743 RepID=UPI002028207C|nr:DUF551 domain-containing protein [Caballeronia sp. GAWG1-5s-s]